MWLRVIKNLQNINTLSRALYTGGIYAVDMSHDPIKGTNGTSRMYIIPNSSSANGFTYPPSNGIHSQTATGYDSSYYTNLVVGSGTTPVTEDDYCLESEITTLSSVAVTTSRNCANGTVTYKKTMTNTSSDAITVSEIGIAFIAVYATSGTSSSGTAFPVLAFREVLDTPITVAAGDTFTITITHQLPVSE